MELPIRALENERIAPDTTVIRQLAGEDVNPVAIFVNSMVITGAEPVIVDTGPILTSEAWREKAFEVVDPADVRWIYLSHDDNDHTGSLRHVLEVCSNATLVTNWFSVERLALDEEPLPAERMRWVNDGESFWAGDRELVAVVPPTFDSPTTRGLFDTKSRAYWAVDSFATPVPFEVSDIGELPEGFFGDAFLQIQRTLSPWHRWLDTAKYGAHLDRIRDLGAEVVASAHGPTLRGEQVAAGLELLRRLPDMPAVDLPGQADLEAAIAAVSAGPAEEVAA